MGSPFSVKIFLADGVPEGLRIVEKDNWNGCGVVCPRPVLKASQHRSEFSKPGVYLLLGPNEDSPLPKAYIGEADPVGERFRDHDTKKDFWTRVIFFTGGNLNKAHVQYLETRLFEMAKMAKRCILENRNTPTLPTLSDADSAYSQGFLKEMLLCFGVLGVDVFEVPDESTKIDLTTSKQILKASGKGIEAMGYVSANGFVVRCDSKAVKDHTPSLSKGVIYLREKLVDLGVLKKQDEHLVFTQDYEFGSPSTASSVVLAQSSNGRKTWRDKKGRDMNALARLESVE